MPQFALATEFAETVYRLQPTHIDILPPFFDWRGLYRIRDTHDRVWMLRLLRLPAAFDAFSQTAYLLQSLEHQRYLAPQLRLTHDHQQVGFHNGWSSLLLSYIDGVVLDVQSTDFTPLASALAQLHTLSIPNDANFPRSRCDPVLLQSQTARQLLGTKERIAPSFHVLITTLYDSLTRLTPQERPLCLTHGDCWYKNAIKTPTNRVVLIDWDCAGIGLPILDLGYLLLTAHYDLNQPFQIAINANKIQAIMDGYQHVRRLTQLEAAQLDSAVLFALAFHVAEYVTEQPVIASDDVFLRKVQVRFAASAEITQLARQAIW